jgi:hypothetical protein
MPQQPIRGKVARVLSDRELVVNIGTADGVTYGMQFDIIETVQVKDPDTSTLLGTVERSIVSLTVFGVQEHLSVLYSHDKSMVSGDKGSFSRSLLSSSRALVNIGDPVVQVLEEKAE